MTEPTSREIALDLSTRYGTSGYGSDQLRVAQIHATLSLADEVAKLRELFEWHYRQY